MRFRLSSARLVSDYDTLPAFAIQSSAIYAIGTTEEDSLGPFWILI